MSKDVGYTMRHRSEFLPRNLAMRPLIAFILVLLAMSLPLMPAADPVASRRPRPRSG